MSSASVDESEQSANKADSVSAPKPILSPRDQEILMAAWLSIKGAEPQVDYDKLAKILGLKNAHCANTSLYNVKKKIKAYHSRVEGDGDAQSNPLRQRQLPKKRSGAKGPLTPKSGKAAKRVKVEEETSAKEEQDGSN